MKKPAMRRFVNQSLDSDDCVKRSRAKRRRGDTTPPSEIIENAEFIECEFTNQGLTTLGSPDDRDIARNLRITNCRVDDFFGTGAIFDEIVVDGLRTSYGPVILSGCVFRHVVLKGKLGSFLINRDVDYSLDAEESGRNEAFIQANQEFYASVDWALDISEAKATCIEIRGCIPARLIRRNPEEQFVLTREAALAGKWKRVKGCEYSHMSNWVRELIEWGVPDNVLVLRKRTPSDKLELEYCLRLRDKGILT